MPTSNRTVLAMPGPRDGGWPVCFYAHICAALLLLALGWNAPSRAAEETLDEKIAVCDAAYEASDLEASRRAAVEALGMDDRCYAAHWKLARALIELGNKTERKEDRRRYYEEARDAAQRAVALREDDTWGHSYLAAAVGKLAMLIGGKRKIELSRAVRDEAQRAIELAPDNDIALHILARWHREIANLGALKKLAAKVVYGGVPRGASNENAIKYFELAIAVAPEEINHHLELGNTYLKIRRYQLAIGAYETCLALPARGPSDPEYKQQAQRQLAKARRRAAEADEDEF